MHEAATQRVGQQKEMTGYQTVKYSQDMAAVIRQAVARHPDHFSQFALVTIEFHIAVMNALGSARSATHERSTRYLLNAIRTHTRQHDLVWLKDTTCYFLLADANLEGGDTVQHRLWKVLVESIQIMQEYTIALPSAMTIGCSAYPEPSQTIEQCLNDALTACGTQQHDDTTQVPSWPEADLSMMARQLGVPYL